MAIFNSKLLNYRRVQNLGRTWFRTTATLAPKKSHGVIIISNDDCGKPN